MPNGPLSELRWLPFVAKAEFLTADLDDRQAFYIALANLCWSPDRLNEI